MTHPIEHREEIELAKEGDYIAAFIAAIPTDAVIILVGVLVGVAIFHIGAVWKFFVNRGKPVEGGVSKPPENVITADRFEFVVNTLRADIKLSEERTNAGIARIEKRLDALDNDNRAEHQEMDKQIGNLRECIVKIGTKVGVDLPPQ